MQNTLYFAITIFVVSAVLTGTSSHAQEATKTDSAAELNKLLTKRRTVLVQRVDVLEKKLTQGLVKVESVVRAREQLLDAELQLATTKQQRLKIYQTRISNMRRLEEALKLQHEAGENTLESLLSATAARLQAEIDLTREKKKNQRADNE